MLQDMTIRELMQLLGKASLGFEKLQYEVQISSTGIALAKHNRHSSRSDIRWTDGEESFVRVEEKLRHLTSPSLSE